MNETVQENPPTFPKNSHSFDVNQNLNFDNFFPEVSPTQNAATILEGMSSKKPPGTSTISPLFSSNQNFSTSLLCYDFLNNLLKTLTSNFAPSGPNPNFDTSLCSFNVNFGSFESFGSTGATPKPPPFQTFHASGIPSFDPSSAPQNSSHKSESAPTLFVLLEHL